MSEYICECGFVMTRVFRSELSLECTMCPNRKPLESFTILRSEDTEISSADKKYIHTLLAPFDRTNLMVKKTCPSCEGNISARVIYEDLGIAYSCKCGHISTQ